MIAPNKDLVAELPWDEVAARIAGGAAGILPIGAGAKEHGLHLPMNTDEVQADWLAGIIAQEIDALVWPTVTYGFYPAFVQYPGSASLSEDTFKSLISDIASALVGFGARPVLIVNTGISTIRPIDDLLARDFAETPVVHIKVHDGPRYRKAVSELSAQAGGTHADELETSRMLALAPELVKMERATASPPGKGGRAGPLSPSDPDSPNFSPGGSWGDPTLATPAKGAALQAAMRDDVIDTVNRVFTVRD